MTNKPKIEYVEPDAVVEKPKKKKSNAGRPTKYSKKYVDLVYKYVDDFAVDDIEEFHKTRGEKSDTYERVLTVKLPTIEGFSLYAKIAESTLYLWQEKHQEFSEALAYLKKHQKQRIIENAMAGRYNQSIARLVLSHNHGMVEKKEVDHTSGGEKITGFNYVTPDDYESND